MPSLARGRPSAATPRQPRGPIELPVYEPVLHPLNPNALHELQALPRNHKLASLNARLEAVNNHLTEAAAEVNDRLVEKSARLEKLKRRRENADSQRDTTEEEQELNDLRDSTNDVTKKLDQRLRDMIDMKVEVSNTERALKDLETNTVNNRGQIAPTQSTLGASQLRSTNQRTGGDDDEDDEDIAASAGLYQTMQRILENNKSEYDALSMSDRYATQKDYVAFKKIVHDAQHPGESAPPLPNASTWFPADSHGPNSQSFATTLQNESDDDFQVESERTTVRCPITQLRMKQPMQSLKCPHNFEREAIFEMLRISELGSDGVPHRGRATFQRAVKCPECEILLTAEDLQPNQVLLRKIKRLEEEERRQEEQSESEGENANESGMTNREEISSSPVQSAAASYKRERLSQAPSSRSRNGASMVPSTQIQDLTALDEEDNGYG